MEQCNDKSNNNIIDEDSIHLLAEGKSLDLIQFDPIGENESTWDASNSFLKKHFTHTISSEECDSIIMTPKWMRTQKIDQI